MDPNLAHTIINTKHLKSIEYKLSRVYCFKNIPLDTNILSQIVRKEKDIDAVFYRRNDDGSVLDDIKNRLTSERYSKLRSFLENLEEDYRNGIDLKKYQFRIRGQYYVMRKKSLIKNEKGWGSLKRLNKQGENIFPNPFKNI